MRTARNLWPLVWRTLFVLCTTYAARAGGPRWVTGPPYFTASPGKAVAFYTPDVRFYTDPGNLSLQVSHADADAMVARAAAVWNVPVSRLTLAQGGALAEHISTANTYFDGTRLQLPADAQPTNYLAKPIAVVYDTDGGVIDTLLGAGASAPADCRQSGVVESVDDLNPDGTVHHALLLLNGRCATDTGDALLQMQYQLTRAFGRVLGLAWSQLNDNVFTGSPTPTAEEMAAWPLMHPIDVLCGPYTFLCMQDPFRLRTDDIASLVWLYPVTSDNIIAGKTLSYVAARGDMGTVTFPTGQGMQLANLTVRRRQPYTAAPEGSLLASTVVGILGRQFPGNALTMSSGTAALSAGRTDSAAEAMFLMPYLPLTGLYGYDAFLYATESINPLYTADYAVGPYLGEAPALSGSSAVLTIAVAGHGAFFFEPLPPAADAASVCAPGADGTENSPAAFPATGFWSGQLCAEGHASWFTFSAKPGRTWTVETTALDEGGGASTHKARPVLGAWLAGDAPGMLPTVAVQPVAFNTLATGVTALRIDAATTARMLRWSVADERGFGRPDFAYAARVLYVDSVSPATLPAAGGAVTIAGSGFRPGNKVLVHGVAAVVQSWSANTLVAVAPTMSAAGLQPNAAAVDVSVVDPLSGSSSVASSALLYSGTDTFAVAAAGPPHYLAAGAGGAWSFSLLASRNGTLAAGVPVAWSATQGLTLTASSSSSDATGAARVGVATTGLAASAPAAVTGCVAANICVSTAVYAVEASQWAVGVAAGAGQSIPAAQTLQPVTLLVSDAAGHPLQSAVVTIYQTVDAWGGPCPIHGRCPAAAVLASSQSTAVSAADGTVRVTPLELPGTASTVNIAASCGTQGFVTVTLVKSP